MPATRPRKPNRVNQKKVIALLATGEMITRAARAVGVAPGTVHQWRREDPWFREELENALQAQEEAGKALMRQALPSAMEQALELLQNKHPNIRLGAVNSITNNWGRLIQARTVEDQIAALEQQLQALKEAAQMGGTSVGADALPQAEQES